jgi:hypothetical protein
VGGLAALFGGYYKAILGMKTVFALVSLVTLLTGGLLFLIYFRFLMRDLRRTVPTG